MVVLRLGGVCGAVIQRHCPEDTFSLPDLEPMGPLGVGSGHPDSNKSLTHSPLAHRLCQQPVLPSPPPGWPSPSQVGLREIGPGAAGCTGPEDLGGSGPGAGITGGQITSSQCPPLWPGLEDLLCLLSAGTCPQSPVRSAQCLLCLSSCAWFISVGLFRFLRKFSATHSQIMA